MAPVQMESIGTGLVPGLRYRDLGSAIGWLCEAFGFEAHSVVTAPGGDALYAELTFGTSMIMLGTVRDSDLDRLMTQPDEIGGVETQSCYLVVADADAHYERARMAGAEIALDIEDQEFGGRGFSCRDPEGHLWNFGTYDPWLGRNAASDAGADPEEALPPYIDQTQAVGSCANGGGGSVPVSLTDDGASIPGETARPLPGAVAAPRSALVVVTGKTGGTGGEAAVRVPPRAISPRGLGQAALALAGLLAVMGSAVAAGWMIGASRQPAPPAAEQTSRESEPLAKDDLAKEREARAESDRALGGAREQLAAERTARELAERAMGAVGKELTSERDARAAAELSASEAREEAARLAEEIAAEREARTASELSASQAREESARLTAENKALERSVKESEARLAREQSTRAGVERAAAAASEKFAKSRESADRDLGQARGEAAQLTTALGLAEQATRDASEELERERAAKASALRALQQVRRSGVPAPKPAARPRRSKQKTKQASDDYTADF